MDKVFPRFFVRHKTNESHLTIRHPFEFNTRHKPGQSQRSLLRTDQRTVGWNSSTYDCENTQRSREAEFYFNR